MMKCVPGSTSTAFTGECSALALLCLLVIGCHGEQSQAGAEIEFTQLPPAGEGTPNVSHPIAGTVKGARRGQRIVLFARSGLWWVQPLANNPFTEIQKDATWKSTTHPGTAYAAL